MVNLGSSLQLLSDRIYSHKVHFVQVSRGGGRGAFCQMVHTSPAGKQWAQRGLTAGTAHVDSKHSAG